ncbi:PEP-CTERM sorting domain-containing protein [Thalassotalea euphylliae]|uniref:PEP-CTERM sorting domain-containing protein n=1 Tax=Thalassotalea euphylliae TaxID=1655234 RepID=UPI00362FE87F
MIKQTLFSGLLLIATTSLSQAGIIKVDDSDFNSGAGVITFSEFALGTTNPAYTAADYGGDAGDPDVNFGGWFNGQSLSANPLIDCPGAAASACIVGNPTNSLGIDTNSPNTFIVGDGSNPTSPVLSGTPTFNGGIAVLFSTDQFGVGFDGGFFNAVGSTAITAFARDGSLIGSVANTVTGIEFLGLVTDDNTARIAGVFLDLVGAEPAGFAIDNIRFGGVNDINVVGVSEPSTYLGFVLALSLMVVRRNSLNK